MQVKKSSATPKRPTAPKAAAKPVRKAAAGGAPAKKKGGGSPVRALGRAAGAVTKPYADAAKAAGKTVKDRFLPPMTDKQRKAATFMKAMLGEDKLGGKDRTFNHQDIDAVAKGIKDRGFKGAAARGAAPALLRKGLADAGVQEKKGAPADDTDRSLLLRHLHSFGKAGDILKGTGPNQLLEGLGLKVEFPKGISQDAMTHVLDGKFGLPPGAKIVPANKDGWGNE